MILSRCGLCLDLLLLSHVWVTELVLRPSESDPMLQDKTLKAFQPHSRKEPCLGSHFPQLYHLRQVACAQFPPL